MKAPCRRGVFAAFGGGGGFAPPGASSFALSGKGTKALLRGKPLRTPDWQKGDTLA